MPRFFIHLPPKHLDRTSETSGGFYGALHRGLTGAGGDVQFRERTHLRAHTAFEAEAFHFVHQGLVALPNALNTAPSYLRGFWYADPQGVFGESSLHNLSFDPAEIATARAQKYAGWLRARTVAQRLSKHRQPETEQVFASGHVAVFLQGESLPVQRAAYMSEVEMVRALAEALPERQILVKRHPRNAGEESWEDISQLVLECDNLALVDANVHDILRSAALCCSISSSVAIEAMLHRVPSLVFGRTDFHHCVQTVERTEDVAEAAQQALARDWPYDAFLFWFFRHHCLDERAKDWLGKLNRRLGTFALPGLQGGPDQR